MKIIFIEKPTEKRTVKTRIIEGTKETKYDTHYYVYL